LFGLGYNTWSHERTETNRSVRVAAFEVLKNLGELQLVVDYLHNQKDQNLGNPITGWGRVLLIKDLSAVIPEPAPREAERLFEGLAKGRMKHQRRSAGSRANQPADHADPRDRARDLTRVALG
jgi:hypothetical protein